VDGVPKGQSTSVKFGWYGVFGARWTTVWARWLAMWWC